MEILKQIFNDFKIYDIHPSSEEHTDESCIGRWYERNALHSDAINFIKNYQFPKEFFENYSIHVYPQYAKFFFENPYCFGKIQKFSIFCLLFKENPEKFVEIFENKKEIFGENYQIDIPKDLNFPVIDTSKYSSIVQEFYCKHIIEYVLKTAKRLAPWKSLNTNHLCSIIENILESNLPDKILEKYVFDLETILENFNSITLRQIITPKSENFFLRYPTLIITILKNNLKYLATNNKLNYKDLFAKLPEEVIDFIEREYDYYKFKNKKFSYFFYFLYGNPNLSYKKHPNVYTRTILETIKIQMFTYKNSCINVPEEIVNNLTPEEAYAIVVNAKNIQGFYINLPIKKLIEKASIHVIAYPEYLEELRNAIKYYKQIEMPNNPKKAKILFYEYCLNKVKNKHKHISYLLREIYKDFSPKNKQAAIALIGKVITEKDFEFNDKYALQHQIANLKKEELCKFDEVYNIYKDIILKVYEEVYNGNNY